MMAILPYWFLLPQVMQRLYGFSALQAGIAFLPLSVTTFLSALVTAPVTSAGIYEVPDEIAGSASGLTNAMHQL
ncbi:MAG: hypothetical protein ACI4ET_06405, partial [Bilifractor sp.]